MEEVKLEAKVVIKMNGVNGEVVRICLAKNQVTQYEIRYVDNNANIVEIWLLVNEFDLVK